MILMYIPEDRSTAWSKSPLARMTGCRSISIPAQAAYTRQALTFEAKARFFHNGHLYRYHGSWNYNYQFGANDYERVRLLICVGPHRLNMAAWLTLPHFKR